MTSLDDFLEKSNEVFHPAEIATGSFSCMIGDCDEINIEAVIDRANHKLAWICSNGHKNSVAF